jgi:tetratricopeptide (TPR) repeat protein
MLSMLTNHVNWQQWIETGGSLNELEDALNVHFVLSSTLNCLPEYDCWLETICLHRDALKHFSADRKRHASVEVNLGNALRSRGQKERDVTNLEEAVLRHEAVVKFYSPDHSGLFDARRNLGESLHAHSKSDEEIALHRETLKLCQPDHPHRLDIMRIFGEVLMVRGEKNGDSSYLEEVIELHREMVNLCPAEDPRLFDVLNNLGGALLTYGEKSVNLDYLTKAIFSYRKALELRLPGHPRRVQSLRNLGNALMIYGEKSGNVDSLVEAVTLHRRAQELRLPDHFPSSAWLRELGDTSRIYCSEDLDGIENVIAICRKATAIRSRMQKHLVRAEFLTVLGEAFEEHAMNANCSAFLEKSVSVRQIVLRLHPPGHQHHRSALNSLASGLSRSIPVFFTPVDSDCGSYLEDLAQVLDNWKSDRSQEEKGISKHETTVEARSLDNSDYPEMLLWFGRILVKYDKKFENTHGLSLAVPLYKAALITMKQGHDHCDLVDIEEKELEPLEERLEEIASTMEFDSQEW